MDKGISLTIVISMDINMYLDQDRTWGFARSAGRGSIVPLPGHVDMGNPRLVLVAYSNSCRRSSKLGGGGCKGWVVTLNPKCYCITYHP
jgi:hypothetical protein